MDVLWDVATDYVTDLTDFLSANPQSPTPTDNQSAQSAAVAIQRLAV